MPWLFSDFAGKPLWMWGVFFLVVIVLIVLDLGLLHRKPHRIGMRESLLLSAFYISAGLLYGGWVWWSVGEVSGKEYLTGFLIEKTLSMDNLFVISLIFSYFKVPAIYQHRVLLWGIIGVIVLRGTMIGLGYVLITQFHFVLYIFAGFLIYTGIKMLLMDEGETPDIASNHVLKLMRKHLPITEDFHAHRFLVRLPHPQTGKLCLWATPLLVALILIEIADIMFAFDSIPAIFAITTDPFVIYTSNVFAILGLRALYFALSACFDRFEYLKQTLSIVLIFIGSKIFIADILGLEKFPADISLIVTVGLLGAGVAYSLYKTRGRALVEVSPDHDSSN